MMDHSYALEVAETIRFHEEIRSLMRDELDGAGGAGSALDPAEAAGGGSSFTALLGLAPHQAAELLGSGSAVFVAAGVKNEPEDSDAENAGEVSGGRDRAAACRRPAGKRKEPEKKVKSSSTKKNKSSEEEGDAKGSDSEKLPYVHVRARRGQATDSHSLAERARREKINARMKLLQELVPGCSKISGTALVLDEIINHVQSLQRQVEFLSMKLAAVNPRIDFSGLDNFLAAENPRVTACNGAAAVGLDVPLWAEVPMDGGVRRHPHLHRHQQQQIWQADMNPPQLPSSFFERSDHHHHHQTGFLSSGPSSFPFDTSNSSVALSASQLKMETDL